MSEQRHRPAKGRRRRPALASALIRFRCWSPGTLVLMVAALAVLGGCAPLLPGGAGLARSVDNEGERAIVLANGDVGQLAVLHEGSGTGETVITVHGINAGPDAVAPIHERAALRGARLLTFVYDDRRRRLVDSSEELARGISREIALYRPRILDITGHSMGGRIAVSALGELSREGKLRGQPIELCLLAPALGGFAAANMAKGVPRVFDRLFAGVAPGKDMGSRSAFQASLDEVSLPENVRTRIFVGGRDRVIDAADPRFLGVARRLRASVVLVPGADHDTIVDRVAAM